MHFILGILGAIVTILVLLKRLQDSGIDIGWLNPFSWKRRRAFRKQYELTPAYSLESPLDVAALFMVAVAKGKGEMSREQRECILQLFSSEFKLTEKESMDLLGGSVHLFGRGDEVLENPAAVLRRSKNAFSSEQVNSVVFLLNEVAKAEGEPSLNQTKLIKAIEAAMPIFEDSKW